MKILVIEDDRALINQLCGLLEDKGYKTAQAADEREAEQVLIKQGDDISVAIVDMRLPSKHRDLNDKESGLRIVQHLISNWPNIKSIVHTAYETFEDAMKCMAAGASFYIVKGSDPEFILKIVDRAVKRWKCDQKLKKTEDAIMRVYKSLPDLIKDLSSIAALLGNLRNSYERIQNEIRYIEEEHNG